MLDRACHARANKVSRDIFVLVIPTWLPCMSLPLIIPLGLDEDPRCKLLKVIKSRDMGEGGGFIPHQSSDF